MILAQFVKAIVAMVGAFGTALVVAADNGVTSSEWWKIIGGALVVGAATWGVPNKLPPDPAQEVNE